MLFSVLERLKTASAKEVNAMEQKQKDKTVAVNRKARHDYFIADTWECGIVLTGTEIKSVRAGKVNLTDSYAKFENGELWMMNAHISPYEKASWYQHDPRQNRKLLMHKKEIIRLLAKIGQEGLTLVPLSLYFSGRNVKAEIGLCKGKKLYDKRAVEAKKAANRSIERELKQAR